MPNVTRKAAIGALAALTLGTSVVTTTTPAAARGWGVPVAAGIIGGLALGAIAASARPHYYAPPPAYAYPPEPAYYPVCRTESRPVYGPWHEFLGWRPVRVCD
jgi:hypothetical protein